MRSLALSALLVVLAIPHAAVADDATLTFLRDGAELKRIDRATLERQCKVATVTIDDAYYGSRKRYRACPLAEVLVLGFGPLDAAANQGVDVFFRARDGYEKPASLDRVREPGGYLAFADADHMNGDDPGWQPIDRKQADPGPYYVVWEKPAQRDAHRYPWPYQLAQIELSSFSRRFPHIAPTGMPDGDPAWSGFRTFRGECIACHAINGEGGTVGPDLNVPQSVVEYRPPEQIKAYIRNPETFRYTSMPAHEYLTAADLDALVAYFQAMRDRKHDPKKAATP